MKLKDFLKQKRKEKGFSQARLAKLLGYSSGQFVSNWERGESMPPVDRLAKMVFLFQVPKDQLLNLYLSELRESKVNDFEKAYRFHEYQSRLEPTR